MPIHRFWTLLTCWPSSVRCHLSFLAPELHKLRILSVLSWLGIYSSISPAITDTDQPKIKVESLALAG